MSQITRILIDGQEMWESDPRTMTGQLLTSPANLRFWSLDALRELLTGTCELVNQWCQARLAENPPDELKGKCKRFHTWAAKTIKNFPAWSQKHAVIYIYNIALAVEGCGLLRGFGISNGFGDQISGNPEIKTLRTPDGSFF